MAWSSGFDAYLRILPWAGHGIDWRRLPHEELHLVGVTDEQVAEWGRSTVLGKYRTVLLVDSAAQPGVICGLEDGLRDFDLLFSRPEGYICGVPYQAPGVPHRPVYDDFVEIRSWTAARAIARPSV